MTAGLGHIDGLTRVRDGPVGVVLAGAAGVGKTRLAREALPLGAFAATLGPAGLSNREIAERLPGFE